ncbi:MAG: hypothetical protein AAB445_00270 [Patescibacteria group bacterium]
MTLQLRRALALFFICLFVLVAPAALAYGRGYRFNFSTGKIQQTGVILLHGLPKNVFVSTDSQPYRGTTLPKTYRSVDPGTHTLHVQATGYTPQEYSVHVQPGTTSYLMNVQLLRNAPFTTLRTALPSTAQFAPPGNAVAWVAEQRVVMVTPDTRVVSKEIPKLQTLAWVDQALEVFGEKSVYLGQVNHAGVFTPNAKRNLPDTKKLTALAQSAGLTYTFGQRVDALGGWFVTNGEGGWFVHDNGLSEIVTRWSAPPVAARIIGNSVLAIIRPDSITLRNLVTNHSQSFALKGIRKVADNPGEGSLDLLVTDGDLRSWVRAEFF